MNTVLWILQALVALIFVVAGGVKVFAYERARARMHAAHVMPQPMTLLVGTLELLGAIGLILPMLTGILPWLTPLAAAGLSLLMVGATAFNVRHHQTPNLAASLIVFVLAVLIAVGRFSGVV
jgi:uncharacterized membrane protein YphA (DoxX/SURF4 family)